MKNWMLGITIFILIYTGFEALIKFGIMGTLIAVVCIFAVGVLSLLSSIVDILKKGQAHDKRRDK